MHGGTNKGAPAGNLNAAKHGLFAASFRTDVGATTYEAVTKRKTQDTAIESAALLLGKVQEAYTGEYQPKSRAGRVVVAALVAAVKADELTQAEADRVIEMLASPAPATLAKALAPLKGLLDHASGNTAEGWSWDGVMALVRVRRGGDE